jgi:TolB-like protein
MAARSTGETLQFDDFELDVSNGELRKRGMPVAIQPQPFKLLVLLATRSGHATSREEIHWQLWGRETFVDFKCGLNFCIRQIRKALGEDARNPRYIETLHRRGYRFIAPLNKVDSRTTAGVCAPIASAAPANREPRPTVLAILPFSDLGSCPWGKCLADGITELLTTYLSTDRSLRVVSRTTSERYKHSAKLLPQIGKELRADRILEGAVLHSGGKVRITARLINTSTDQNEWAGCYEAEMRNWLDLQVDIAWAVIRDTRSRHWQMAVESRKQQSTKPCALNRSLQ